MATTVGLERRTTVLEGTPTYVWLFLLGLVANMFAGNWAYLGVPAPLDRGLILLAVTLLVLDPLTRLPRVGLVHVVMAACVLWDAASWLSSGSVHDSLKLFALSDRVVVPLTMFVVGGLVFSTVHRRLLLLRTLAVVGIYLGITAIGEIAQVGYLVWPHFISNPSLGIQYGRARGPFLESEAMGMTCALTFFSSGLLLNRDRSAWRWIASAAMALSLTGVALSLTRSVWISTVLASLLIGFIVPSLRRRAPLVFAGVIAGSAALLASLPTLSATLQDRLTTQRSVDDRITTNHAAVRIIETHPLTGIGWGNFFTQSSEWVRQGDLIPLTNVNIEVHNVFLARAAETGLPGAALWAACMLGGPVWILLRRAPTPELQGWRVLTLAAVLVWLFPSLLSPNNYPLPNNLVWLIGGIAGQHLVQLRRSAAWRSTRSLSGNDRQQSEAEPRETAAHP